MKINLAYDNFSFGDTHHMCSKDKQGSWNRNSMPICRVLEGNERMFIQIKTIKYFY